MNFTHKQFTQLLLTATALASTGAWAEDEHVTLWSKGGHGMEILGAHSAASSDTPSKGALSKVSGDLLALHQEYQTYKKQASGVRKVKTVFKSTNKLAHVVNESVVFNAASANPKALVAALRKLGARKFGTFGRVVSGRLPLSAIPSLAKISSLQLIRPAYAKKNPASSVISQGDAAMRSDIARTAFGVDGSGVKVGTLSDSYNCLGAAAAGVASGDLPAGVTVLEDETGCSSGTDEGRAMMEIIHDVAPGAALSFHSAFNGEANFAQGIKDLATAGAIVINDDVFYFDEPFYQDGIVAQAVNTVKGAGVAYFSSAGNQARQAYESAFNPSGVSVNIGYGPEEAHDFDPGAGVDTCQRITIPAGRTVELVYQWDQPFFSAGGTGSASDMDIIITNSTCTAVLAGSASNNIGGDPFEFTSYHNSGATATFGVMLLHFSGPNPGLMKTANFGSSSVTVNEFDTKSATNFGHSAAVGALATGAAFYQKTPEFGVNPPVIEGFSSAGGSPILFTAAGVRLATPEIRQKPEITAPDGVDTTFFGFDVDGTGHPNFFGTSAAAPHAAGVAALMKAQKPTIATDSLYSLLKLTAIDMDDPFTPGFDSGFDFGTGHGLIQADSAISAAVCDANNNGSVSVADLLIINNQLRATVPPGTLGDVNHDGVISTQDTRGCALLCTAANCANPV